MLTSCFTFGIVIKSKIWEGFMKKLLSCFLSFVLMFGLVGSFCRAEEAVTQEEFVIEDTSSKLESKEVKGDSIWEITLNYIKDVLFNVRDFGLKSYPVFKSWLNSTYYGTKDWTSEKYDELKDWSAENYLGFKSWLNSTYYDTKDWTSEKYDLLKSVLNSTYYDAKDWTSEKYDEGKVWFNEADASKKVAGGMGVAVFLTVLLGTIVHCCKRADTPVAAFESIPEVYDEFADDMRHWGANLN